MIKGLFFIFLFYFLGEAISVFINGYMPGSVLGMILLFLCLFFKILKPEYVKDAATVITKNMAVFFVPVSVGLMAYAEVLSASIWTITLAIVISTILTIITVAVIQEQMEKRRKKV
jgi:Putative effector of murein hydrolase LrgA